MHGTGPHALPGVVVVLARSMFTHLPPGVVFQVVVFQVSSAQSYLQHPSFQLCGVVCLSVLLVVVVVVVVKKHYLVIRQAHCTALWVSLGVRLHSSQGRA